jgi:hypothetical protein
MTRAHPRSAANDLEAALSGQRRPGDAAVLAALAGELEGVGRDVVPPTITSSRREELRLAVFGARERRHPTSPRARFRGAVLTVAAVAGAGLVVAGAASRSNPAVLVMDAARELPKLASRQAPPAEFALEGEVVATRDEGRTLEVRAGGVTVIVETPRDAKAITSEGTPVASTNIGQGDNVRVTTRDSGDGPVAAKKIEVLPPVAAADSREPAAGNTGVTRPSPSTAAGSTGSNVTPGATKPASPTPTKPAAAATAIGATPTFEPKRTATPEPTATVTQRPKPTITATAATPAPIDNNTSGSNTSYSTPKK